MCVSVHAQSCLFMTQWTVAHQASLFMEFSNQEYWSGLLFPSPGHLPDAGVKPMSPASPALAGDSLPLAPPDSLSSLLVNVR